jgi:phage terminase large subunit-like protein
MVTIASSAADLSTMADATPPSQRYDLARAGGAVNDDRTVTTTGKAAAPLPTLVFRLALSLRRCGATAEADILFSKSSRMLSEQYVTERLRRSCQSATLAERAA